MGFWQRQRTGLGDLRQVLASRRGGAVRTISCWLRMRVEAMRGGARTAAPMPRPVAVPALVLPEQPAVSIIVPVYNHVGMTLECLRSIAAAGAAHDFEVVVVDDASDEDVEPLHRWPGIVYLRNPRNSGFVASCNAGAAAARGAVLVFLNNDTLVGPGWLDRLLETLALPGVGLAGARLRYPDGQLQEAGGIVFSDGSAWNYGRGGDPDDPRYSYRREVDYCSGAAIALARGRFVALGGFDLRYAPAYYEDTDLAMAVRASGGKVVFDPAADVVHLEGMTAGTDVSSGVKSHQTGNRFKFSGKWAGSLDRGHPVPGTHPDVAVRLRARFRVLAVHAPGQEHDPAFHELLACLVDLGCAVDLLLVDALPPAHTDALRRAGICVWPERWRATARWMLCRTGADTEALLEDGTPTGRQAAEHLARDVPQARRFVFRKRQDREPMESARPVASAASLVGWLDPRVPAGAPRPR